MILNHAQHNPQKDIEILSLDAEKAFDNVKLSWLFTVLNHMGYTGEMLHLLRAMYSAPRAMINTLGSLSAPFTLLKGMRQGCPLSPLLFNFALEPPSRALIESRDLTGVEIGKENLKATMFADDILLFLSNPSKGVLYKNNCSTLINLYRD